MESLNIIDITERIKRRPIKWLGCVFQLNRDMYATKLFFANRITNRPLHVPSDFSCDGLDDKLAYSIQSRAIIRVAKVFLTNKEIYVVT